MQNKNVIFEVGTVISLNQLRILGMSSPRGPKKNNIGTLH